MCFRPAEVLKPVNCANCGKKISAIGGTYPKECPFCKTALDIEALTQQAAEGAPPVATPGAPSAPGVPGAPRAPLAPSVPTTVCSSENE